MVIAPNSKIKLIKNPLKLDSNNEIMFASKEAQYNYFNSLPKLEFDELTYIRTDGVLRIETDDSGNGLTYEDLLGYNFCMYQNTHFDNKWFYAFITDIKWVNPSLTDLKLETAYFQTWQFDLIYKDSFIEREHVDNDTIGLHTIPEGLETGEYIVNDISKIDLGLSWYVMGVTKRYDSNWSRGGGIYNGIYSGKTYYAVRTSADVDGLIQVYDSAGYGEDIAELFIVPAKLIGNPTYDVSNPIYRIPQSALKEEVESITITRPNSLNGYVPKNNKLFTHPFQYILVDNNAGSSSDYHYELFTNPNSCKFSVIGALTPGTSMVLLPIAYLNSNSNPTQGNDLMPNLLNYGMQLGKFPTCNWNTDLYTNWLTQNGVNMTYGPYIAMAQNLIGGISHQNIEGGAVSGVISGINAITNNMIQKYQHSFSPNQSKGNANSGDVITSCFANTPHFYKMSIKYEYAKACDDYFSLFGYKVNRVGTPHLHVRNYFDFIKTINVNIEGDVPESDLNHIRSMFNNGIRFWHDTTNYLNFSVNNNIIS
ncbi:MAG: hypothetical protein IJ094_04770 [Bacilli bacterium]|nr:hypothetical protein [Bacilli bacterium]